MQDARTSALLVVPDYVAFFGALLLQVMELLAGVIVDHLSLATWSSSSLSFSRISLMRRLRISWDRALPGAVRCLCRR